MQNFPERREDGIDGILRNPCSIVHGIARICQSFFKKVASRNYLDESGREEDNNCMRITLKGQKEEDKNGTFTCEFLF